MFTNKSVTACVSILFVLAAQTSAHAIPNPALGVKGTPQRSDVQRPSTASPCGSVNIASNLDTSTAVAAAADGTVTFQVQNFNAGADGSTSVSVQVDPTGAGKKFVAATVKTNGNKNPSKVESDKVVVSLPAGTKCTGGKAKNLCLLSVKTTAGFGACTVVSQGKATANPPAKAAAKPAAKPAAAKSIKPTAQPSVSQLAAKQTSKKTVFESCALDSECQQGCCGFSSGKCAGPDVAQSNGSGGCGHGAKAPNCNVATLLGFSDCVKGAKNGDLHDATIQAATAFTAKLDGFKFTPSVEARGLGGKLAPGMMKAREALREVFDELE
ncbi:hypothetical protein B0H16DRAFT_1527777 [Mycena metata]|uniref:Uncharacterized protein n=1 Tax=Mycena metata TaxID=1033252 RepID=A0AAD7JHB8_9AGAR|nr:hypothetical protein B0H16DRAFT_1527777 [Mycena metata]